MSLHTQALSESGKRVFDLLCQAPIWRDFYLAGGTGLALQIGHRISADFDFFSAANSLDAPRRAALRGVLSELGRVEVDADEEGSWRGTLGGVPVSFFRYDSPLLEPLVEHEHVKLASPRDIALMKLRAVVGRGSRKDFFDLYFLARENIPLDSLLDASQRKFPQARDFPIQALRALVYFEDAEGEESPLLLKTAEWMDVKRFFRGEASRISREWFGA